MGINFRHDVSTSKLLTDIKELAKSITKVLRKSIAILPGVTDTVRQ